MSRARSRSRTGPGLALPLRGWFVLALAVALGGWLVLSTWRSTDPGQAAATKRVPAPEVSLVTERGEVRLADLRGRVALLYFAFPGCAECVRDAPTLSRIQRDYATQGVRVIAINVYDSIPLEAWKRFWLDVPGAGEVLWAQDQGGRTTLAYQVRFIGQKVILDREGRVVYQEATPVLGGAEYEQYLARAVQVALAP